ncbi:ankyrin [Nemania sp. FL0916]|nr:ankyrin [Nemania sp. FL0916]
MTTVRESDVLAASAACTKESGWDTSAFERLLERKWDVNSNYGHIGDALCMAVSSNKPPLTSFLLSHGASPNANLRGETYSPLELCALPTVHSDISIVSTLLNHGAVFHGRSAMLLAACSGRIDMLQALTSQGADVDALPDNEDVYENAKERDDWGAPLHGAAGNGQVEVVKWLLGRGARKDVRNYRGLVPREVAERKGYGECAELL